MTTNKELRQILLHAKTIAVVGLSPNPARPSHEVAAYLQAQGYTIIPVNPKEAGKLILGEICYASLADAAAHAVDGIDIVDCFRQSDAMPALVDDAISARARCIWMQLGVSHPSAAMAARSAGISVVMDRCIKIDHAMLC